MVTRIRQLLEQKQLTPTQFADAIGVGRPVMSHILSERNKPSLEVVQRIIEAFPEVSMPWLLKGIGEMIENDANPRSTEQAPASPVQPEVPTPITTAESSVATLALPSIAPVNTETLLDADLASPIREKEAEITLPAAASPAAAPAPKPLVGRVGAAMPAPLPPAAPALEALEQPAAPTAPALAAPKPFTAPRFIRPSAPLPATAQPATPPVASTAAVAPQAPAPVTVAPVMSAMAPAPYTPASVASEAALLPFLNDSGKAIRRIVIFYRDGSFADYQPEQ